MKRLKVFVGGLSMALCICAFGASSASALTFQEGGSSIVGKQTIKWTKTQNTVISATIAGVEFQVTCTGLSATQEAENNTKFHNFGFEMVINGSNLLINYEGCTVTKPAGKGCTVASPILTEKLKSETIVTTDRLKYLPESGTTIATLVVSGPAECPAALKGSKALTGSMTAVVNESTGEQEFTATSGSELKYAGQTAAFTGKNTFDTTNGTQVKPATP